MSTQTNERPYREVPCEKCQATGIVDGVTCPVCRGEKHLKYRRYSHVARGKSTVGPGKRDGESYTFFRLDEAEEQVLVPAYELMKQRRKGAAQAPGKLPDTGHSEDFRSLRWFGISYSFTAGQAPIVKALYEAYVNGTPDVGQETLLEIIDRGDSRLVDVFRGSDAWGKIIVPGGSKGSFRLKKI